jgi:hypothetical protein
MESYSSLASIVVNVSWNIQQRYNLMSNTTGLIGKVFRNQQQFKLKIISAFKETLERPFLIQQLIPLLVP